MPLIAYIFLTIYTLANVYFYLRIRPALPARRSIRRMAMIAVVFLYSSYWMAELGQRLLPSGINAVPRWTGSRWIGFLTIILVLIDLLRSVLRGVDPGCPVILLDHQPARIGEAVEAGVDLLLCGHTHHGQLFPLNLITDALYQLSCGYGREGETRVYVTSGAGTWALPVRVGNIPEIMRINVEFGPAL